jgi:hypothetical protein
VRPATEDEVEAGSVGNEPAFTMAGVPAGAALH